MGDDIRYDRAIGTDQALGNVGQIYLCFNAHTWTFWFVARVLFASVDANDHFLFDMRNGADTQRLSFIYRASDDKFVLRLNHGDAGAADVITSLAQTFSAGAQILGAVAWDFTNDSYKMHIGSDAKQLNSTARVAPTTGTVVYIGQDYLNANILKAAIFYYKFDDIPYADADYTTWYNSSNGTPFYVAPETVLCPAHCVDSQGGNAAKLSSTNLDIVSFPKLMPNNTDYTNDTDNCVDDGNMEEAGTWIVLGGPTVTKITTDAYEGAQCMKVYQLAAAEGSGARKAMTLDASVDYLLTAALKWDSTACNIVMREASWGAIVKALRWAALSSWTRVQLLIQNNATATKDIGVQQYQVGGTINLYLDYVSIMRTLFTNGGFDSGVWAAGVADGWTVYEDGAPTYAQDSTNRNVYGANMAYSTGTFDSQKITTDATGSYYGIQQTVNSLAIGYYTVLAYVDTNTDDTDFFIQVTGTTLGTLTSVAKRIAAADGWKRIGFSFYLGTSENVTFRFYTDKDSAIVNIDDAALILLDSDSPNTATAATEAQSYETGHF